MEGNEVSPIEQIDPIKPLDKAEPVIKIEKKSDLTEAASITFMVTVIVVVALLGISRFGFGYGFDFENLTSDEKVATSSSPTAVVQAPEIKINPSGVASQVVIKTEDLNSDWVRYTNTFKHFSINLPKNVFIYGGDCTNAQLKNGLVPMKVTEAADGSYVTVDSFYDISGGECTKFDNGTVVITNRLAAQANGLKIFVPKYWKIMMVKTTSESDISDFVLKKYGNSCSTGTMTKIDDYTYDVPIQCPGTNLAIVKYSPKLNLLANWDAGQEVLFAGVNFIPAYDSDMISSFRFIP